MNQSPFALSLFLPDGIIEGMKIIEKSNWNGCGLSIPRGLFAKHKNRPELQRPGVYFLIGDLEFEPKLYIGEGDPLIDRLKSHESNKEFWDILIAFTSKDQNLNKAIIQFLESRLCQVASKSRRFKIENANAPKEPSLSEMEKAISEGYLRELLLCIPVLGLHLNEAPLLQTSDQNNQFSIQNKNISANGTATPDGFVVLKGSQCSINETNSIPSGLKAFRQSLLEKGILEKGIKDCYSFTQDYLFGSPSTASGVVLGRSSNGRVDWKNNQGLSMKELEEGK